MGLEEDFRKRIRDALGADPTIMHMNVYGSDAVSEDMVSDTRFLNMVARTLPVYTATLEALTREVDALNAVLGQADVEQK